MAVIQNTDTGVKILDSISILATREEIELAVGYLKDILNSAVGHEVIFQGDFEQPCFQLIEVEMVPESAQPETTPSSELLQKPKNFF